MKKKGDTIEVLGKTATLLENQTKGAEYVQTEIDGEEVAVHVSHLSDTMPS